ncbi:hypothetical protein DIURU_001601 [Diutina rugosa]|uniref:Ubiquinol-cytochrome C reductase hinge domain-containing protein n=1 Tax=Diutina rugosa TaxID=5481 RepID=A0A642UTK1_DIURU|nr:uncharacterized protein DIURU_001601 [Diutina rugosa]KAA8905173.1 hypothetical protein DIURU_001601 [Diutina rugosa]
MSLFKDLLELVTPVAYAEEAEEEVDTPEADAGADEDKSEVEEEAEEEEDAEDEEEDEDEEEELEDPQEVLREECKNLPECQPFNHHLEECIERVTKAQEHPDYHKQEHHEDCVEEFFHQQHFINECMAPKLFHKLK